MTFVDLSGPTLALDDLLFDWNSVSWSYGTNGREGLDVTIHEDTSFTLSATSSFDPAEGPVPLSFSLVK